MYVYMHSSHWLISRVVFINIFIGRVDKYMYDNITDDNMHLTFVDFLK